MSEQEMFELAKQAGYGIQYESYNGSPFKQQIWGGCHETYKLKKMVELVEERLKHE